MIFMEIFCSFAFACVIEIQIKLNVIRVAVNMDDIVEKPNVCRFSINQMCQRLSHFGILILALFSFTRSQFVCLHSSNECLRN